MTKVSFCKGVKSTKAFTLVEVSLVLGLVLILASMSVASAGIFAKISSARKAETILIQVEHSRIAWLLDNPQKGYPDLTLTEIAPYMPTPESLATLSKLGYTVDDKSIQQEEIIYTARSDAMPIPGFANK